MPDVKRLFATSCDEPVPVRLVNSGAPLPGERIVGSGPWIHLARAPRIA